MERLFMSAWRWLISTRVTLTKNAHLNMRQVEVDGQNLFRYYVDGYYVGTLLERPEAIKLLRGAGVECYDGGCGAIGIKTPTGCRLRFGVRVQDMLDYGIVIKASGPVKEVWR